jgi:hypothetical protein
MKTLYLTDFQSKEINIHFFEGSKTESFITYLQERLSGARAERPTPYTLYKTGQNTLSLLQTHYLNYLAIPLPLLCLLFWLHPESLNCSIT